MGNIQLTVGIISESRAVTESLQAAVRATGRGTVALTAGEYFDNRNDPWARRFAQVAPEIVIVDMNEPQPAIDCLSVLRSLLPGTWLLVHSSPNDANILIEAVRAGAREFLPKPATADGIGQAFARFLHEKGISAESETDGAVYCVFPAKGGAGATTLAINLAASMSGRPKTNVALVDLSGPLGGVAPFLNVIPRFSVHDALCATGRLDSTLLESFTTPAYGFHFLAGAEQYRPDSFPSAGAVGQLLDVCRGTFTHTFVDLPFGLDEDQFRALADRSQALLLVLVPEVPALWRADRLLRFLQFVGQDRLHVVLNRTHAHDEITVRDVEKTLGRRVSRSLPDDPRAAIGAANAGRPLVEVEKGDLARACRDLATQLTGVEPAEKRRGLRSLLKAS